MCAFQIGPVGSGGFNAISALRTASCAESTFDTIDSIIIASDAIERYVQACGA